MAPVSSLRPLGLGLDGPVYILAAHEDVVMVGGRFRSAFQTSSSPLLFSVGGRVSWHGSVVEWLLLGGVSVSGAVDACVVHGHRRLLRQDLAEALCGASTV